MPANSGGNRRAFWTRNFQNSNCLAGENRDLLNIFVRLLILWARSFETIPEYSQQTVFVLFWELFRFRNERKVVPFILLLIAE